MDASLSTTPQFAGFWTNLLAFLRLRNEEHMSCEKHHELKETS
jgi:hypothetical protein